MRPRSTPVLAAIIAALLLAGCAPISPQPDTGVASELSAETATPTPTVPTIGTVVDEATGYQLQKDTKGRLRGYPMADGSYVVVDRLEPLPAPVQADLSAKAGVAQAANQGGDGTEVIALAQTLGLRSGKRTLIVSSTVGYETAESTTPVTIYWVAGVPKAMDGMHSMDEAVAAAQAYIDGQSAPAEWAIVVAG